MKTLVVAIVVTVSCLAFVADCRPQQSSGGNAADTDATATSTAAVAADTTATSTPRTPRVPPGNPSQIVTYVSCPCPFTREYNPVCGTDGLIYGNMAVLRCAQRCGTKVDVYLIGACGFNNR